MRNRRGFTLVELLVALVLLSIVGGVIIRLMATSQRLARTQSERVQLQSSVRTGALLVPAELRELSIGATSTDIVSLGTTDITYRAMRSTGVACAVSTTQVKLRSSLSSYYRQPAAGRDSLMIYMEGDPAITSDDRWGAFRVTGSPAAGTCPDGAAASVIPATVSVDSIAKMALETPVRSFEIMQLALMTSGGQNFLGARSVSAGETLSPVLGPLQANGLQIAYLAANGSATTTPTSVRTIEVTIRGLTQHTVSRGAGTADLQSVGDSLVTRIRLRNAPAL